MPFNWSIYELFVEDAGGEQVVLYARRSLI